MAKVELETSGDGVATLNIQAECDDATMRRTLGQLVKLCEAMLDADAVLDDFPKELPENRQRAAMAVAMKGSYHFEQALALYQGVMAVTAGVEQAAGYGFPEFGDDAAVESLD